MEHFLFIFEMIGTVAFAASGALVGGQIEAVEKLDEREKLIMELRFGLNNRPEKTQKEVADMIGISQSYISRLEKRIIKRLKKEMESLCS